MVEEEFFPIIKQYFNDRIQENHQVIIRTEGIPEEKIFNELCPTLWSDLEKFGKVSSLPHTIGIDIIVSYYGEKIQLEEIKKIINGSLLAPHVWHWGPESLPELILKKSLEKNITFSFAESCTGGLVSSKITDLSGASQVFIGSVVSYANAAKENLLDVDSNTLEKFGAVSSETAIEMAKGALNKFKTDIAISITGIAGPSGGTPEKPIGTVVIGFATINSSGAKIYTILGDRLRKKERFSDRALLTLLEMICKMPM
jgi:nicotinamide-nucleotide amidase